ncbi:pyridoxamine 5'-phosphate oxidase family protein [Halorientalis litorea]|jgi:nitroimidazol reductase NimA-like FMN-containing flavoprotein (pyridoxamine 5'-phosphate oxidase superfamily)|uniref:pyridoxamine 5'-phosphate oxidase family protein n=1 Tax=Halorientalis litorea TaxID=2931977 RepID=UPI001FF416C6|nr:pyridoxamine 5'-phosphate oxidase family protein [Halorientalis litorea]
MRRLTDDEVVDVLQTNAVGVLGLNDDPNPTPYQVPIAFGYDAASDCFAVQLEGDDDSRKKRCLGRDAEVSFTVYEETDADECWRSVVVKGELTEIEYREAEPAFANLAQTAQSTPNPVVWGDSETVTPYKLDIDSWSGREFTLD